MNMKITLIILRVIETYRQLLLNISDRMQTKWHKIWLTLTKSKGKYIYAYSFIYHKKQTLFYINTFWHNIYSAFDTPISSSHLPF